MGRGGSFILKKTEALVYVDNYFKHLRRSYLNPLSTSCSQ